MGKIFISYRRAEPDQSVVSRIQAILTEDGHEVFRDTDIPVGKRWAEVIQQELDDADVFVVFISEQSMDRDMVREEVKQVYQRYQLTQTPMILPVRLDYEGGLPYDMNSWLAPIQYALWRGPDDTELVARQLCEAIKGSEELPIQGGEITSDQWRTLLEFTEGKGRPLPRAEPVLDVIAMKAGSEFYVERDVDAHFLSTLSSPQGVATLHAPKQMGKSSLLARTEKSLRDNGLASVFLDLKVLASESYETAAEAMFGLAALITEKAKLDSDPDPIFAEKGFAATKLQKFLAQAFGGEPVRTVLLFDDIDSLFHKPYRDAFFGGLRTVIDQKANDHAMRNIGFGFAYAYEAGVLIKDRNQSPFYVGSLYGLHEFDDSEISWLNKMHHDCASETELTDLSEFLGGHPYLTRVALYRLSQGDLDYAGLKKSAATDDGPFGDHLRSRLFELLHEGLAGSFNQVLSAECCDNPLEFQALLAMGMVSGESHKLCKARYGLYESYFMGRLDD